MKNEIGRQKVYNYIIEYMSENLYAPSIRDICRACGYTSTSTVYSHLYRLQKDGLIRLGEPQAPRCIKLIGYKLIKEH